AKGRVLAVVSPNERKPMSKAASSSGILYRFEGEAPAKRKATKKTTSKKTTKKKTTKKKATKKKA
ncbi:MAG: hypothetical protein AAF658_16000, partial [Myxococcota bacterium]